MTSTVTIERSPVARRATSASAAVLATTVGIAAAYVLLRVIAVAGSSPVATFPDTRTYLDVAHASLFSGEFWAGDRSFTVPLLYKLVAGNEARVVAQVAISIAAWLALAFQVAKSIDHRRVAITAAIAVLAFSCTPLVTQWDSLILSESLALSLTAALVAVTLSLLREPSWPKLLALGAVAILWASARDTNGVVLLLALPLPLVWLARSPGRRLMPAAAVAIVLVAAGLSIASASRAHRDSGPITNVIGSRVLGDADQTRYFTSHGMPMTPSLRAVLHVPGFIDDGAVAKDPTGPPFLRWVDSSGRPTYLRYLATHPGAAADAAIDQHRYLLEPDAARQPTIPPLTSYRAPGHRQVLPAFVTDALYPPSEALLAVYVLLLTALTAATIRARGSRRIYAVPIALATLSLPYFFLVATGDAIEVARHALVPGLMLRLALVLMAAFAIDAWLRRPGEAA